MIEYKLIERSIFHDHEKQILIHAYDASNGFELVGTTEIQNLNKTIPLVVNVWVRKSHRRCGIASQLMQLAVAWAFDNNKRGLWWTVGRENLGAISLYEKLGARISYEYDARDFMMTMGFD